MVTGASGSNAPFLKEMMDLPLVTVPSGYIMMGIEEAGSLKNCSTL